MPNLDKFGPLSISFDLNQSDLERRGTAFKQSRKQSRSPSAASLGKCSRSRSPLAVPKNKKREIICWHGRACSRVDCWFKHPDGREIDDNPMLRKRDGKGKSSISSQPLANSDVFSFSRL